MSNIEADRMVFVPSGSFLMGSERFYREERPVRRVSVDGFWIDEHPVTNEEFARFVEATGYATLAERPVDPADYPTADPELLVPGSAVFVQPDGPVDLRDVRNWWTYVPGACWWCPQGPGSSIVGYGSHPVVHVAYSDAQAYAQWVGKTLPTEAEWEYAARGGLDGAAYPWGDEAQPDGTVMANTWAGSFPWENLRGGGYAGTSPVRTFPPNGYGLYDCAGNVWEWTADPFLPGRPPGVGARPTSCCAPSGTAGAPGVGAEPDIGPLQPRVIKGGSYLCAPNYCQRYRPAARQGHSVDTSTCHLGFRCTIRSSRS
jgi:sulfatase modifying factor 1